MFSNDCKKNHLYENYEESCCVKHLVMMSDFAENQMMIQKYAKLLMKTLNHNFKLNLINYENMKFDILKLFLEVLSKYIAFFYSANKSEYAKILVKIGLDASTKNEYSEHPEILSRKMAILNNLSCMYQRERKFGKSIKYSKYALNCAISNLDKALVYNNLAKIYLDNNELETAASNIRCCYESFKEEAERLKIERIKTTTQYLDSNTLNKANLITFLFYNYGLILEKLKVKESIMIFNRGLKFSVTLLGDNSFLTLKLRARVYQTISDKGSRKSPLFLIGAFNSLLSNKKFSIDSKSDSEVEDLFTNMSHTYSNITKVSNKNRLEENLMTGSCKNEEDENDLNRKLTNITIKDEGEEKSKSENVDFVTKMMKNHPKAEEDQRRRSEMYALKSKAMRKDTIMDICIADDRRKSSPFSVTNIKYTLRNSISKIINKENNTAYNEYDISQMIKEFKEEITDPGMKLSQTTTKLQSPFRDSQGEIEMIHNNSSENLLQKKHRSRHTNNKKLTANFLIPKEIPSEMPPEKQEEKDTPELKELIEKENNIKKPVTGKKKRGLKEMFSMAFNSQQSHNSSGIQTILSNIFKKSNFETFGKRGYFRNVEEPNVPCPNQYDQLMNKIDDNIPDFEIKSNNLKSLNSNLDTSQGMISISKPVESIKTELISEMKKYSFQIQIDNAEDSYRFEPLFVKDERLVKGNSTDDSLPADETQMRSSFTFGKPSKKMSKRATEYFKQVLKQNKKIEIFRESEKNLIDNVIDYYFLDDENNYYRVRKTEEIKVSDFMEFLVESCQEDGKLVSTLRKIDEEVMKVTITCGKLGKDTGIYLRLYKKKALVCENFIYFEKISNFIQKMCILNILPKHIDLFSIKSVNMFLEKILIYLCYPIFNEDSKTPSIAVVRKPVGIFAHKTYEFEFLKSTCSIDFMVHDGKCVNMFIMKVSDSNGLQIYVDLDEECFGLLFEEIAPHEENAADNETFVPSFVLKNYKHMGRKGFIPRMVIRIQEVMKAKMEEKFPNETPSFDVFMDKFSRSVMQIRIRNELRNIDLWMINYENNYKWLVDYYTLEKIEISNSLFYVHKTFTLDDHDYINVIGTDPRDNVNLLTEKEMVITNYLLLNTVKLRNINIKILTEKNYDAMMKLTRIIPVVLLRHSHTLKHNKHFFIVSLEFLIYSKSNYFIKILITETHTCRTYSKLFLPFYMYCNKMDLEEVKKDLETVYNLSKKSLEEAGFKRGIKTLSNEWAANILHKNINYNQFDTIDVLIQQLESTFTEEKLSK